MDIYKKIIVSIPFITKSQLKTEMHNLCVSFPKIRYVEIRFDYHKGDFSDNLIEQVAQILRSYRLKFIFTHKMRQELDENYVSSLKRLISHKPDYIDLDIDIVASTLTRLAENAIKNKVAIVYSYHNKEETPSLDTISEMCEFFIQMLPKFTSNTDHILKMVFMATKSDDVDTILEFAKKYGSQGINLISFCMGELGKPSRIKSIENGCAFIYAHIGIPTAPGQLHVSEIQMAQ
jgi:3-dehydroquinate dehydratase type I